MPTSTRSAYIDGFLLPVPKRKLAAYRKLAKFAAKIWIEHGALDYREAVGDDLDIDFGLPFPKRVGIKKTDTIIFAWILYPSKAARKKITARVMSDPRMEAFCDPAKLPFDMKAMSCGGFKTLVHLSAP